MISNSRSSVIHYFGEPGSFSHLVAQRRFGNIELQSCPTVEEGFDRLRNQEATQIVVPIENASAGMIVSTVDQLIAMADLSTSDDIKNATKTFEKSLAILEALTMKIELALLALDPTQPIQKIYSHLAPFNHAREWLQKNYPEAKQIIVASTSEAAQRAQKEAGAAAIAGVQTATIYGLKIVRKDVGSEVANRTTFLVIGNPLVDAKLSSEKPPTHTMLLFEVKHEPGTLLEVLKAIADEKINLTKIESRPIPGRFSEYRFMIEFEAVPGEATFENAMQKIKNATVTCACVGSYPYLEMN